MEDFVMIYLVKHARNNQLELMLNDTAKDGWRLVHASYIGSHWTLMFEKASTPATPKKRIPVNLPETEQDAS
jgi:hypothetical protein